MNEIEKFKGNICCVASYCNRFVLVLCSVCLLYYGNICFAFLWAHHALLFCTTVQTRYGGLATFGTFGRFSSWLFWRQRLMLTRISGETGIFSNLKIFSFLKVLFVLN